MIQLWGFPFISICITDVMTIVSHQLLVVDALRLMSPVSRGGFQSTIQRHLGSTLMCKVRDIMHCTRDGIWHVENMTLLQIHSRWDFWLRCSKKKMVYLTIYTGNVCSDTMKFESSFKRSMFLVGGYTFIKFTGPSL